MAQAYPGLFFLGDDLGILKKVIIDIQSWLARKTSPQWPSWMILPAIFRRPAPGDETSEGQPATFLLVKDERWQLSSQQDVSGGEPLLL